MKITEDNAHEAEALAALLEQFIGKTNIEEMLSSYVQEVQELENVLYSLFDEKLLDTAVGAQLDLLGRIVQEPRRSSDDEVYRKLIRGRIAANRSSGTIPELLNLLTIISEIDDEYILREYFPASLTVEAQQAILPNDEIASFDDVTYTNATADRLMVYPRLGVTEVPWFASVIMDLLRDAKAAGIKISFLWNSEDQANIFQFSSQVDTVESSSLQGFANNAQTTGGYLSGVIS